MTQVHGNCIHFINKKKENFIMWNRQKFKDTCDKIVTDQHEFNGNPIFSRECLYEYLESEIHVNKETIKRWTQTGSKGPRNLEDLRKIEEVFEMEFWESEKDTAKKIRCSELGKENIQKCYELLKDHIASMEVEDEQRLADLTSEIDKLKLAIPPEIYEKIEIFIKEEFFPMVYEYERVFEALHKKEYGEYDENHTFCVKREEEMQKIIMEYFKILLSVDEKLEKFASEELAPLVRQ